MYFYSFLFRKNSKALLFDEVRFSDHIATLQDFLFKYRREPDAELRVDMRKEFGQYIIFTCWPKMHRRVKYWSNLGYTHTFVFAIASSSTPSSMERYHEVWHGSRPASQHPKRQKDGKLTKFLNGMSSSDKAKEILESSYDRYKLGRGSILLPQPIIAPDILDHVKKLATIMGQSTVTTAIDAYTSVSSFHFHHIISFVLYMLLQSLYNLSNSAGKKSTNAAISKLRTTDESSYGDNHDVKYIISAAQYVKFYTDFLWRISHSAMFTVHLEMLSCNNLLDYFLFFH